MNSPAFSIVEPLAPATSLADSDLPAELTQAHIRFLDVGKTYPGQSRPALRRIDLHVNRGEVFGIIGRSGAGKSSLLRTINRLERPTQGQVFVDGIDIGEFDEHRLVGLRRRIGMIFQHFNLMSAKTVWQNIELPLKVAGVPKAERQRKVETLLDLVGLADKRSMYPAQLSGGQKQRVGIARALVHDPEILLCDEATSALDPETTASILALLRDINRRLGLTIVLITHEMAVIRDVCHRVVVLDDGEACEQGEVWQVFGDPHHAVTRTLLAPLQSVLPAELQAQIRPASADRDGAVVLKLKVLSEPSLSELMADLGGQVRLLQGGVERIGEHAIGSLTVAVRGSPHAPAQLILRAKRWADDVEVLGHVA